MDDYDVMIADCITREERLSDWERVFIDSIDKRRDAGLSLTPKQIETLEAVWERATVKG